MPCHGCGYNFRSQKENEQIMKRLRFVLLLLLFALCVGSFAACGSIGVDLEKEGYTAKVIFDLT